MKHFRRSGKRVGKCAVCGELLPALACTVAGVCTAPSSSFQPLQPGAGLWDEPQRGRTMCGHGLLGCSALMNWFSRHSKSTCVFVRDKMGVIDVVGFNVLMRRYKLWFFQWSNVLCSTLTSIPSSFHDFLLLFFRNTGIWPLDVLRLLVLWCIRSTTAVDIHFI